MCLFFVAIHFIEFYAVNLCFHHSLPFHFFALAIISNVLLELQKVMFVNRLTALCRYDPGVLDTTTRESSHTHLKYKFISFVFLIYKDLVQ